MERKIKKKKRVKKKYSSLSIKISLLLLAATVGIAYGANSLVNNQEKIRSKLWTLLAQGEYPGIKLTETRDGNGTINFEVPFTKFEKGRFVESGMITGQIKEDGISAKTETDFNQYKSTGETRKILLDKEGITINVLK